MDRGDIEDAIITLRDFINSEISKRNDAGDDGSELGPYIAEPRAAYGALCIIATAIRSEQAKALPDQIEGGDDGDLH